MNDVTNDAGSSTWVHQGFEIGILLKGLNGLAEVAGGILLCFVRSAMVQQCVAAITHHELIEDPGDIVANYLMNMARDFSISARHFTIVYLLSHGIIKIILVLSLWKQKLWAYPSAIVIFGLFVVYQIYRYTFTHSAELIILTFLDIIIIALTWLEFNRLKKSVFAA